MKTTTGLSGAWLLALVPLAACAGDGQQTAGEGRGVLLVAVDALRHDRTSLGRSDADTTPTLAALAGEGASFDDTWSPVPRSFDAHVALLTGCDPLIARRPTTPSGPLGATLALPQIVPQAAPSIAVEFLAGGFETAAFVDDPGLTKARGFDRGFQQFSARRGGDPVDERVADWVEGLDRDQDWFAFVHFGDLGRLAFERGAAPELEGNDSELILPSGEPFGFHSLPRSMADGGPRSATGLQAQYDATLVALDRRLARLVAAVRAGARGDRVSIVVVGTYGMPFGESGVYVQPTFPDAPDLRVPWVLQPAADIELPRGRSLPAVASLVDVGPTLLELVGLPVPAELHGLSRMGEVRGDAGAPARRHVFARGGFGSRAVVDDGGHWIELFPRSMPASVLESWLGVSQSSAGPFERWIERSGPTASDPLQLHRAEARPGPAESRALWARWAHGADRARDLLHFGATADGDPTSLADVAATLRALQQ